MTMSKVHPHTVTHTHTQAHDHTQHNKALKSALFVPGAPHARPDSSTHAQTISPQLSPPHAAPHERKHQAQLPRCGAYVQEKEVHGVVEEPRRDRSDLVFLQRPGGRRPSGEKLNTRGRRTAAQGHAPPLSHALSMRAGTPFRPVEPFRRPAQQADLICEPPRKHT